MLDEKIFDAILDLSKQGIETSVSYNEDRDTYRFDFRKKHLFANPIKGYFEFTPQFYNDAVSGRLFIIEKLKKLGIQITGMS